jgi:arylsulfatase A-like enzyme
MADDLGWGDVEFNGGTDIRTPHLTEMAKQGLVFHRFYSASAVCSPTRGSCLTGRHPNRLGIYHANVGHMPDEEATLAEILRAADYRTGHFGKWHLGTLTKELSDSNRGGPKGVAHFAPPWRHGFETCFSTEAKTPTWDPMLKPKSGASGKGWEVITDPSDAAPYGTRYFNEQGEVVEQNLSGDDSRIIMDRVIPFVQAAARARQPFFAVVWLHSPHLPVVTGDPYFDMYEGTVYEKSYRGCVTALDEQVGRLREELRALGVADNTMLWFCSDNGPEGKAGSAPGSAGPLRGRKRDLYEGGVRVPGVIEWPAVVKPGSTTNFPAVTSDYLPTVLDVLGITPDSERPLDGVSLLPVLKGAANERQAPIGFAFGGQRAWMEGEYKLITRSGKDWELYQLTDDPGESSNLAASDPERTAAMRKKCEVWYAGLKATAGRRHGR